MLKTDDAAFVLVDVQGKLANLMYKKERLFQNLQILVAGIDELGLPIIWAEQYPEGLGENYPGIEGNSERSFSPAQKIIFGLRRSQPDEKN